MSRYRVDCLRGNLLNFGIFNWYCKETAASIDKPLPQTGSFEIGDTIKGTVCLGITENVIATCWAFVTISLIVIPVFK